MDGVKVKKVEERDSVLGSVGGARTDPNPEPDLLAQGWELGSGLRCLWLWLWLSLAMPRWPC